MYFLQNANLQINFIHSFICPKVFEKIVRRKNKFRSNKFLFSIEGNFYFLRSKFNMVIILYIFVINP